MTVLNTKFKKNRLNFLLFTRDSSPVTNIGFTLLEIMIALAVVGGLLVTLIYTLNYHLGIAERHEAVTIASMLAKDKMAEIEKTPAETKGEFPEPYSDYHYVTEIKESSYPDMSEISVIVNNGKEEVKLMELIQSAKRKG